MRRKPRQRAGIGVFGKSITRRAHSRCELCGERRDLRLYELDPFPADPVEERVLLACERCRRWLERDEFVSVEGGFISGAVWSELPAVRLAAARILLASEDLQAPWLLDALEAANIDPVTRELRPEPSGGP